MDTTPQQLPQQNYKFNEQTQWPNEVNGHVQKLLKDFSGKPMSYSQHSQDRMNQKNLSIGTIPGLDGKFPDVSKGWRPVEVEHNGTNVTKLVMRGPYSDTHDAVMPVLNTPNGPHAATAWPNEKRDMHNTLDLNRVHLPEEYQSGQLPQRRLATNEETKQKDYRPVPSNSDMARKVITTMYGPKQKKKQRASSLPSFIDYDRLKANLGRGEHHIG